MHEVVGAEAGAELAFTHLLLLPHDEPADVVIGLVRARSPEVSPSGPGTWRLGRWTTLLGPLRLDAAAADAAAVPSPWRLAWAISSPIEREGPPLAGVGDRDGLHRAFPDGLPVRAERRAVDLLVALARRLGGAARIAPDGVMLRPDGRAWIDRFVHAPYWLSPDQALDVTRAVAPTIALAMDGGAWTSLTPSAVASLESPAAGAGLADAEREVLHRHADAFDALAMRGPDVLDAYALALDLSGQNLSGQSLSGPNGGADGGLVQVTVEGAASPPPVLAGQAWAAEAVTYAVMWWPADPADAEHEHPGPEHRAHRARARGVVVALADALAAATAGVVTDADGFPVA